MAVQKFNLRQIKRSDRIKKVKYRKKSNNKRQAQRIKIGSRFFYLFKNSNHLGRLLKKMKSIGSGRAKLTCIKIGFNENFSLLKTRPRRLNKIIFSNVNIITRQSFLIDKLISRFVKERINKKMKVGSLYNIRVLRGLPVRGQRNKTNSRSARSYFKRLKLNTKKF